MSKTKKKADKLIGIINSLHGETQKDLIREEFDPFFPPDHDYASALPTLSSTFQKGKVTPLVTMADFQNGEFPWQTGNKGIVKMLQLNALYHAAGQINGIILVDEYRKKHYAIDTWMLRERYKEEIPQTEEEMMRFVQGKKATIIALEKDVSAIKASLANSEMDDVAPRARLRGQLVLLTKELCRLTQVVHSSIAKFQGALGATAGKCLNDEENSSYEESEYDSEE